MLKFLQLHGFTLPSSSPAPTVPRTEEGRALGHIPGWRTLIDPAYVTSGRSLERVSGIAQNNDSDPLNLDEFGGGLPAFDLQHSVNIVSPQPFNPETWSAFAVAKPQVSTIGYQRIIAPRGPASTTVPTVRFGFSSDASRFTAWNYSGGTEVINYTPGTPYKNRVVLIMLTFSTRDGIRLFENGELAQHNDTYKTALQGGYGANEWVWFWGYQGLAGMCGTFDIDLGWPEHAGHRRAIERFLMGKYGISGAA